MTEKQGAGRALSIVSFSISSDVPAEYYHLEAVTVISLLSRIMKKLLTVQVIDTIDILIKVSAICVPVRCLKTWNWLWACKSLPDDVNIDDDHLVCSDPIAGSSWRPANHQCKGESWRGLSQREILATWSREWYTVHGAISPFKFCKQLGHIRTDTEDRT